MTRKPKTTISLKDWREMTAAMHGLCDDCGEIRDCCEPDARNYPCPDCGNESVFGPDEYLMSGLVE